MIETQEEDERRTSIFLEANEHVIARFCPHPRPTYNNTPCALTQSIDERDAMGDAVGRKSASDRPPHPTSGSICGLPPLPPARDAVIRPVSIRSLKSKGLRGSGGDRDPLVDGPAEEAPDVRRRSYLMTGAARRASIGWDSYFRGTLSASLRVRIKPRDEDSRFHLVCKPLSRFNVVRWVGCHPTSSIKQRKSFCSVSSSLKLPGERRWQATLDVEYRVAEDFEADVKCMGVVGREPGRWVSNEKGSAYAEVLTL
ncbi:hypothetical protein R3P38DRAFT_3350734 [Favolaschia claudopus]|uniref:Uncharacterized protein n=1 Tax=Favolaschia claudopus TaxID=2862362 RepID=A0AAW0CAL9_9AGAR